MKTLLAWSSGKDSAWTLHVLRQQGIASALLTTLNEAADRVAMHGVRRDTAGSAGGSRRAFRSGTFRCPGPAPTTTTKSRMAEACRRAVAEGFDTIAFGDLFLRDIRALPRAATCGSRTDADLSALGDSDRATGPRHDRGRTAGAALLRRFPALDAALRRPRVRRRAAGRPPAGADPCGENGEFHTFVYDGPMFRAPIAIEAGEIRDVGGFIYADLITMPRIVSLIASATEIVDALGQLDYLVGRSHECDYPEARAVAAGLHAAADRGGRATAARSTARSRNRRATSVSIYDVFDDVIERLRADPHPDADPVRGLRREPARRGGGDRARDEGQPQIVSLQPNSLADIWDDIRRVAGALGIAERGEELIASLAGADARAALTRPDAPAPRVACIEWIEPLMAAGNWTPELIELAGGVNLFGEAGKHSPWMTWEELVAADPDVIVVAPCGFDLARTEQEMHWLTDAPGWRTRAARRACTSPTAISISTGPGRAWSRRSRS